MGVDIAGLGELATAAGKIVDKIWPDKTEIEKTALSGQLQEAMNEFQLIVGQQEINKIEAANTDTGASGFFIKGWRPAVGWIGAFGFAYAAILEPIMRFIATMAGYKGAFPAIDTNLTLQVLFGLLGIAGLRTYEKKIDVHSKH